MLINSTLLSKFVLIIFNRYILANCKQVCVLTVVLISCRYLKCKLKQISRTGRIRRLHTD